MKKLLGIAFVTILVIGGISAVVKAKQVAYDPGTGGLKHVAYDPGTGGLSINTAYDPGAGGL